MTRGATVSVAQLITPHPLPLSKMERGAIPKDFRLFLPLSSLGEGDGG